MQKNDGIQALRFFLYIGIVLFHFNIPGTQMLWGGVESFFILSAFFLTKKWQRFADNKTNVWQEVKKRVSRLYPVYGLVLIGAFFVVFIYTHKMPVKDLIIHGLFLQNYNWMLTDYQSSLQMFTAHTWTLSIEMTLFLVWVTAFKLLKDKSLFRILVRECE